MKSSLSLHIPSLEELWYRQKIMQDPSTMSYNRGYDLDFAGYDKETGCIAFPKQTWADWYDYFIEREPLRFYAYVVREEDHTFIGEVNLHKTPDASWYEMGIVLEAKYHGQGYATEALRLLLTHAFENLKADAVHNCFEENRSAAVRTHLSAGFTEYRRHDGIVEFLITREEYFRQRTAGSQVPAAQPADVSKNRR
ncbi:MAG: GNAT family N-acetyltransferase [Lachnospiraceae bacterium]|jgi:RimJ/RimL family protein N-acetyltransferase|nr:GNAT family N-acetyltransferase [Lachnospiraceae bacterium]